MTTHDNKKVGRETLAELRKRAIEQVLAGVSPEVVTKTLGFHRSWIYRAIKAYNAEGLTGVGIKKAPGRQPILDDRKKQALRKVILGKTPDQLKMEFALWTTDQVAAYVLKRWDIRLSISTVTRILHDLGLSFQKPLVRAFQQDPVAVQQWLDVDYPKIKRQARKEGAEIFFEDEAGLRSDHHSGRTWGEKGKTPIVKATGARFGFSVVSAVNNKGRFEFMILDARFGTAQFIEFMAKLVKYKRRKIFLIVDGHPVHKSKAARQWVADNSDRIALFFLPSYSPQLNPTELAWNCLKREMGKKTIVGPDNMKRLATDALTRLYYSPGLIASLFHESNVKYAA